MAWWTGEEWRRLCTAAGCDPPKSYKQQEAVVDPRAHPVLEWLDGIARCDGLASETVGVGSGLWVVGCAVWSGCQLRCVQYELLLMTPTRHCTCSHGLLASACQTSSSRVADARVRHILPLTVNPGCAIAALKTAVTSPRYAPAARMKGNQRKAAAARHSLPNTAPANKRIPQPPTTPAATNKRSTRHNAATPSSDNRQLKSRKTQHTPPPTTRQEEGKEAEGNEATDVGFTSLCAVINSLAQLRSQSSPSDRATFTSRNHSILSSLYRLSPPTLSSHHPPSAAVLSAIRSAAEQLISMAQSVQSIPSSSSLLLSQLQQLQSIQSSLAASDTYAVLLSASIAACQLLSRTPPAQVPLSRTHSSLL